MKTIRTIWLLWRSRRLQIADEKTRAGLELWLKRNGHREPYSGMADVAEEIGVSYPQLSYYFRVVIGKPFLTWRKEKRIRDSKDLLVRYPEKSIASIGEAVGIPDKSNFKKQFASVTKMSPSEYRRRYVPSVQELP